MARKCSGSAGHRPVAPFLLKEGCNRVGFAIVIYSGRAIVPVIEVPTRKLSRFAERALSTNQGRDLKWNRPGKES